MPLPTEPDKQRVIELLEKTHAPGVANWTTDEQQEAFLLLRSIGYLWFRDERVLVSADPSI